MVRKTNIRKFNKSRKRKSKFTQVERLAYQMGRVERGKSNPNSRVHESFKNGLNGKTSSKKKPLF